MDRSVERQKQREEADGSRQRRREVEELPLHNGLPFTGRGRADDHSNHSKRSAAAVECSGGLCPCFAATTSISTTSSSPPQRLEGRRRGRCRRATTKYA